MKITSSKTVVDDYAYAMEEYGMSRDELKAFEKRQEAENLELDKRGLTVIFAAPFDPAFLSKRL